MGSPISEIHYGGRLCMKLESIALPKFNHKLWVRYVDDVFTIVKKTDITTIHETLDSVFKGIPFTVEEEKNHLLPFLDVAVRRTQNGQMEINSHRSDSALH